MKLTTQQQIQALKNALITFKLNHKFDIKADEITGKTFCIAEMGITESGHSYLQPVTNCMKYEELNAFIMGISKAPYFTT